MGFPIPPITEPTTSRNRLILTCAAQFVGILVASVIFLTIVWNGLVATVLHIADPLSLGLMLAMNIIPSALIVAQLHTSGRQYTAKHAFAYAALLLLLSAIVLNLVS